MFVHADGIAAKQLSANEWLEKPVQHPENFDRTQMAADRASFQTHLGPCNTQNIAFRALRRLNVSIPDMLDNLEEDCIYSNESLP